MLLELEETGKAYRGRPHQKIAINPAFVISVRAASETTCQIRLSEEELITVQCAYQDLLDLISGAGERQAPLRRVN